MKKIFVLLLLISALGSAGERLKVALVLSGGGAKGAAHIAVLELIEEKKIPVNWDKLELTVKLCHQERDFSVVKN
jgi:NTE family protein